MIDSAGLPRASLTEPELKIPLARVIRLLEDSASAAGIEDLGLRMAESRPFSAMGPLGLVIREQPTLRALLAVQSKYRHLTTNGVSIRIDETDDVATLVFLMRLGVGGAARQMIELTMAVIHLRIASLLGQAWRPHTICFSHPPPLDARSHRRVFAAPVEFDHDFDGIVIDRAALDAAIPTADPVIARQMERYAELLGGRPDASPLEQVRERIVTMLPGGGCSADRIASDLGVDRRTLHRWLSAEQTTFSDLVQTVRTECAVNYLGAGRRSIADVADLLGFSAQSAFTRWFRAAFGCTPTQWRDRRSPEEA